MDVGIYQLRNIINNKVYIGSSKEIQVRWKAHLSELRSNRHCNTYLQHAFNKYGEHNFIFEILKEVTDASTILIVEQHYLDTTDQNLLYNINKEAGRPPRPIKGTKRPISVGIKISNTKRQRKHLYTPRILPESHKHRISDAQRGRVKSLEHRRKISATLTGRTNTVTQKRWKLIHPTGEEEIFVGLKSICEKYNLNKYCLSDTAYGRQHLHKGFKCEIIV